MNYVLHLVIYFNIFLLVALSLNLAIGYGGLLSLAHGAYFALGAYVYAVLAVVFGAGTLLLLVIPIAVGATASLMLSLLSWRLRGDLFVVASLAVQAVFFDLISNWSDYASPLGTWRNLTNGLQGIAGIPRPSIGGQLDSLASFAVSAGAVTGVFLWLFASLQRSPWGAVLLAMSEDELAARSLGKNVSRLKVQTLAISCGATAAAGSLYAAYLGYIDPSAGSLDRSVLFLSMALVGGLGGWLGPAAGAAALLLLPELLRFLGLSESVAANLQIAIFGALLIVLMHLRPQGLLGRRQPS